MAEKKKKSEFSKYPTGDKVILIIGYILLGLFLLAIILPMVYIILASFIDPITLQNKGLTFDLGRFQKCVDLFRPVYDYFGRRYIARGISDVTAGFQR